MSAATQRAPRPRFQFSPPGTRLLSAIVQAMPPRQWLITMSFVPADVVAARELTGPRGAHEYAQTTILCISSTRSPRAADHLPPGAMFVSSDTIEVARLDKLPTDVRPMYAARYRHYLLWRLARAGRVAVHEMVAGLHFDPKNIDARVEAWVSANP